MESFHHLHNKRSSLDQNRRCQLSCCERQSRFFSSELLEHLNPLAMKSRLRVRYQSRVPSMANSVKIRNVKCLPSFRCRSGGCLIVLESHSWRKEEKTFQSRDQERKRKKLREQREKQKKKERRNESRDELCRSCLSSSCLLSLDQTDDSLLPQIERLFETVDSRHSFLESV
jgi:hypothetical protein